MISIFRILIIFISIIFFDFSCVKGVSNNCEVISYVTRCTVNRGKCIINNSMLVEIGDRSAEHYAQLQFRYSRREKLDIILAQIEDTLGNIIRVMKPGDFKEKSAYDWSSLYIDQFIKSCDLNNNIFPYRIRYQYETTYNEFTELVDWDPYLDWDVPTRYARLEVIVPKNYPVRVYHKLVGEPVKRDMDGNVSYTIEVNQAKLPESEINNLTSDELGIRVCMEPEIFEWEGPGSNRNWKEFGDWVVNLNKSTDDLPADEKADVQKMILKKKDKLQMIDTLYRYLQNRTRYISVNVGVGNLKPYPASYVSTNKFGDCKALAVYMQALLKEAGITSFYTLVYAGDNNAGIIRELPGIQFNHAILTIPMENDTMFLDCTKNNVPPGYFGTFTQGREAFMVVPEASRLIRIPFLTAFEVREENHHIYSLAAFAPCKVEIENKLRGEAFDAFNNIQEQLNHAESEYILRERYFNFSSFELNKWNISQPEKDSAYLILKATLQLNNYLKAYGTEMGFQIKPIYLPAYERPAERKSPVRLESPINISDDYEFQLSGLMKGSYTPEDMDFKGRFGRYKQQIRFDKDRIYFHREFEMYRGQYNLSDYQEFYDFVKKIKTIKLSFLLNKI